jgi:hypothetical protein
MFAELVVEARLYSSIAAMKSPALSRHLTISKILTVKNVSNAAHDDRIRRIEVACCLEAFDGSMIFARLEFHGSEPIPEVRSWDKTLQTMRDRASCLLLARS